MIGLLRQVIAKGSVSALTLIAGFSNAAQAEEGLMRRFQTGTGDSAVGYVDASFDPDLSRNAYDGDRGQSEGP